MLSSRALRTISEVSYVLLLLTTTCVVGLSCVALLSQAVRTAPNHSWYGNYNALVIGTSYVIVSVVSVVLCINRRIAVRRRLQRVSKVYRPLHREDMPKHVHDFIIQEYTRTCLIAQQALPKDVVHEGWGRPGTPHFGIRFRRTLLDTVPQIDKLARLVIPALPTLKPHASMLHHFRFILPLLPPDSAGVSPLHRYDAAIQRARNYQREPTEKEFELGMEAALAIVGVLEECRLEMMEDSVDDSEFLRS